jgi:hypothetical protein
VAGPSLHALYAATVSGRIERYLDRNPGHLTVDVARHLDDDFTSAVEFGDLVAASIAAAAGTLIFQQIGMPLEAVDLQVRHLWVQLDRVSSATEFAQIRDRALVAATHADELGAAHNVQLCCLLAAESAGRAADATVDTERQRWLLRALRDLCDLCELLGELSVAQRPPDVLEAIAGAVARTGAGALDTRWDAALRLPGRLAVRRVARAAERVLPRDVAIAAGSALQQRETRERLIRVLLEGSGESAPARPAAPGRRSDPVGGRLRNRPATVQPSGSGAVTEVISEAEIATRMAATDSAVTERAPAAGAAIPPPAKPPGPRPAQPPQEAEAPAPPSNAAVRPWRPAAGR